MKKIFALFTLSLLFISGSLFGESIKVGILNGPSCIPAAKIMEDESKTEENKVIFTKYSDPQSLLPKLLKREIDVGFLPVNVASKVYNSTENEILLCAITGNGNLKLITTDPSVNRFTDLKGTTVTCAGQGATPEYVLRFLMKKNDFEENKNGLRIDFSIPNAMIPNFIITGKISSAIVPEPFATIAKMKSKNVRIAADLQEEYKYYSGKDTIYPMTVMVVNRNFARKNPQILNDFLDTYKQSVEWTVKNPSASGKLCEKFELGLAAGVVANAIPVSNYTFVESLECRDLVNDILSIFLENNPSSIGNQLPGKDFYYTRK